MKHRMPVLALVALSLLALLPALTTAAAEGRIPQTVGKDIRIGGAGAVGEDSTPAVAANNTNRAYLVVWSDGRTPADYNIYGHQVSVDGETMGSDIRISGPGATSHETAPAIVWNAARNEYLVVWGDDRNPSRGRDIWGRLLDGEGQPISSDFRISGNNATGSEYSPAVAWNPVKDQYLVVWEDGRNPANFGIYARRVSALGQVVGGEIQVTGAGATGWDSAPDVAASSSAGEYLVVWEDERNYLAGKGYDIYGRRVSTEGQKLGLDTRINKVQTSNQQSPAIAWNDLALQYLVVWQDTRNYAVTEEDVYGRLVQANGTRVGGDIRVTSAAHSQYAPAVACNPNIGGYLVVWEDWRNYAPGLPGDRGSDTYARRLASDGTRVGTEFRVSGTGGTAQEDNPDVAFERGLYGGYLPVWSDARWAATADTDIVGHQVLP